MQRTLLHLIIQLLVAGIVGLGIAQARADFCLPDCSYCGVVTVAPPCCDNMGADEVVESISVKTGHRTDCDHDRYCNAIDAKNDVLPAHRTVETDCASIAPVIVVLVPKLRVRYHSFSLKTPPQGRQPALYTLHCSLLI